VANHREGEAERDLQPRCSKPFHVVVPEYIESADGIITLRMLEAIRVRGLEVEARFKQASTSEMFGLVEQMPKTEKTQFYPRSLYAVGKPYAYWITGNYRGAYWIYACNGILFNHESPVRGETFVKHKINRAIARNRRDRRSDRNARNHRHGTDHATLGKEVMSALHLSSDSQTDLPVNGASHASDMWRLIVDRIGSLILIVAVVTGLAALYALVAPRIYSSNAVLQIDLKNPDPLNLSKQQQTTTDLVAGIDAQIDIIRSRAVLMPVIEQYGLFVSAQPRGLPFIGALLQRFSKPGHLAGPWLGLKSYAWGGEQLDISTLTVPPELEGVRLTLKVLDGDRYRLVLPDGRTLVEGKVGEAVTGNGVSMRVDKLVARPGQRFHVIRYNDVDAVAHLLRSLNVGELGKDTNVVQISYENSDSMLSAQVANAVAQSYISSRIAQRRDEVSQMLAFVNTQLPSLQSEVARTEAELSQYRTKAGSMQPSAESDRYLQGLIEVDRQIASVKLQRAQLLNSYVPNSNQVRALDEQLQVLADSKRSFEEYFRGLPTSERVISDLARRAKVAGDVYVAMMDKAHELAVRGAEPLGNVHMIDVARRPSTPVRPRPLLLIVAGFVLGVVLCALYLLLKRTVLSDASDPAAVEKRFRILVYGAITYSGEQARLDRWMQRRLSAPRSERSLLKALPPAQSDAGAPVVVDVDSADTPRYEAPTSRSGASLLSLYKPDDLSVEELRSTCPMLEVDLAAARNPILLVTGPTPGTGKSFIAANLAILQAQSGKRVALVDCDLRRGRLGERFGLRKVPGVIDLLDGTIGLDAALRDSDFNGLKLVTAGSRALNAAQSIWTPRLREMLDTLAADFDLVIVDSPPVLAVSDAIMLSGVAGATLLVLRADTQSAREILETRKRLDRAGANLVGALFNAMPLRRSDRRGREYAYAYTHQGDSGVSGSVSGA
jgi:tyrosine-protein kinase Etk/Wzc